MKGLIYFQLPTSFIRKHPFQLQIVLYVLYLLSKKLFMKIFFVLVIIAVTASSLDAQTNDIFKRKPWNEAKLKWLLRDTLSTLNPTPNSMNNVPNSGYVIPQQTKNGVYKIPIKGVYIGDNGKGDEIYAMQPDNMPCLVPGKSIASNMPIAGFDKTDKSSLPLLEKGDKKPDE